MKVNIAKFKFTSNQNQALLFLYLMFFMVIIFSLVKKNLLPNYYYFDSNHIIYYINNLTSVVPDQSYLNTAKLYNFFGVTENNYLFNVFSSTIIYIYTIYMVSKSKKKLSYKNILVIFFFLYISIIYISMISKDFIIFILLIPVFHLTSKNYKPLLLLWAVLVIPYTIYFRQYWALVLILSIIFYIFIRFFSIKYLYLYIASVLLILNLGFSFVLHIDLNHYRSIVNESRLSNGDMNANTIISPFINGNNFLVIYLNTLLVWLSFLFPLPLLFQLKIALGFIFLMFSYISNKIINLYINYASMQIVDKIYIVILIAFTLVQSTFEPDYGSYVRHLSPFFPIIIYLYLRAEYEKEAREN